ncbi:MAG TPA: FABP family protein [Acidimicrobiales bacterium]|nr:FABP family protein [Acidimicrobiales bacterium]
MATVDDLTAFVGTWRGRGEGEYPTIEPFGYTEELVVAVVPGRPVLTWSSRTRDVEGNPRHAESGFLRPTPEGVEMVIAHSFGIVEIGLATAASAGDRLEVDSSSLTGTPSAKSVTAVRRRYAVDGDELTYEIAMAAVGVALTHHLRARLARS